MLVSPPRSEQTRRCDSQTKSQSQPIGAHLWIREKHQLIQNSLQDACVAEEFVDDGTEPSVLRINDMHAWQRFRTVRGLWPYMIPLFVVYATEYALQAGVWTAVGFPVDDEEARSAFCEYSNWMVRFPSFNV
jgi:CLN3 protein